MTSKSETASKSGNKSLSREAIFFMLLLAIQFGVQPILTKRYTPSDVCKSSVILISEVVKFFIAFGMLLVSGGIKSAVQGKQFHAKNFTCMYDYIWTERPSEQQQDGLSTRGFLSREFQLCYMLCRMLRLY